MNFGKNNLGGKDEKKGKRKLEKHEKKVIKRFFSGYKMKKKWRPPPPPNAFIFAMKNK